MKGAEFMFSVMNIVWILILIAAVVVEAMSFTLLTIWFAVGALVALICSALGVPVMMQVVVFMVISLVCLAFTRPLIRKVLPKKYTPTNGEDDIGKNATVIVKIDPSTGSGRVRFEGVDWAAQSESGEIIPEGETVIITAKGAATVTVKSRKTVSVSAKTE